MNDAGFPWFWLSACRRGWGVLVVGGTLLQPAMKTPAQTAPQQLEWRPLGTATGAAPAAAGWQRSLLPDGGQRQLVVRPAGPPETASAPAPLRLPPGRVRWAGVYSAELAAQASRGLQLLGDLDADPPRIEEISALAAAPARLPVPPGWDLGARMDWTPFGVEERVERLGDSPLAWRFKPGRRPAGLYSAMPWRLPARPRGSWHLELTLRGQGRLQVGLAGETADGFGDPSVLHEVVLTEAGTTQRWRVPDAWVASRALRVSLVSVPEAEARLVLEAVRWVPAQPPESDPAALELGVWDWSANPARWRQLQPLWKQAGIRVLQLALPRVRDDQPPAFAEVLQSLRQDGFEVVAVEGDPHMVLPEARAAMDAQQGRLARGMGAWLDAVQYDVEPYLLPGFQLQPEAWHRAWGDLFEHLAGTAAAPVEAVVPFWLLGQAQGPALLQRFARSTRRVAVMNYRSDPVEALAWATAWLEWSSAQRHPVALAIECGPVPDLPQAVFHRAERGRLWVAPWPGQGTAVVLFEDEVAAGAEAATALALTRQGLVPGSRTSLQEQPPAAVRDLLDELAKAAAVLKLPASLRPRLLLHEPSEEVLRGLVR